MVALSRVYPRGGGKSEHPPAFAQDKKAAGNSRRSVFGGIEVRTETSKLKREDTRSLTG